MIEGIKVFGERNSGNNYIMHLLDKNLDLKYTTREKWINKDLGWTHGKVPTYTLFPGRYEYDFDTILFLFIFKNPYSWLLSFKEKPHTHELNAKFKKANFFGFLQMEVEGYKNPVVMLMEKYRNYLGLGSTHNDFIKYEIALESPQGTIDRIKHSHEVKLSSDYFTNITQQTHPSSRLLDKPFDKKEYYLQEQWKDKLGTRDIAFINKHLDSDVMEKLGYEWI